LLAYEGDRAGARDRNVSWALWYGTEHNTDLTGRWAEWLAIVRAARAGGRFTRGPIRRYRRFRFRAGRRRRALVARSERVTSLSNRIRAARLRLAHRFWNEHDA
jgi:hypothetical protein